MFVQVTAKNVGVFLRHSVHVAWFSLSYFHLLYYDRAVSIGTHAVIIWHLKSWDYSTLAERWSTFRHFTCTLPALEHALSYYQCRCHSHPWSMSSFTFTIIRHARPPDGVPRNEDGPSLRNACSTLTTIVQTLVYRRDRHTDRQKIYRWSGWHLHTIASGFRPEIAVQTETAVEKRELQRATVG